MSRWVTALKVDELSAGDGREVVVDGQLLALFYVGGEYFALDGVCPHQGGPLGKGKLSGCVLTCPWHGWQFDVRTGQHQLSSTRFQPRFAVQICGEDILVELP